MGKPRFIILLVFTLSTIIFAFCQANELQIEQEVENQQIVEALTNHKWRRFTAHHSYPASENLTWEFYADGTFRRRFVSDYVESCIGAWSVSTRYDDQGIIFLANTTSDQKCSSSFNVLSFKLHTESLQLGEVSYQAIPFSDLDASPHILVEDRDAVTEHQRNTYFSLWLTMTATDWQSESLPRPGDPTTYSFERDGTFAAYFDATKCRYSGTWSLSIMETFTGAIWLSVPANPCDPRGARNAFVRQMPITYEDSKLYLYKTVYISLPKGN